MQEDRSTRTRILDAAETVFGQHGFEGASIRQIASLAGVNLATLYYHFESKEDLLSEVLRRRFDPVHQEQLARLQMLETRQRPVRIGEILEALLTPVLQFASKLGQESHAVARLIGRMLTEPQPFVHQVLKGQFKQVREKCLELFLKAKPGLSRRTILWRIELMWGGVAFILCQPERVREATDGLCDPADVDELFREMMAFSKAALKLPVYEN